MQIKISQSGVLNFSLRNAIALMRDDVKNFSGNIKARLGGERFAWFVWNQGEIFSK